MLSLGSCSIEVSFISYNSVSSMTFSAFAQSTLSYIGGSFDHRQWVPCVSDIVRYRCVSSNLQPCLYISLKFYLDLRIRTHATEVWDSIQFCKVTIIHGGGQSSKIKLSNKNQLSWQWRRQNILDTFHQSLVAKNNNRRRTYNLGIWWRTYHLDATSIVGGDTNGGGGGGGDGGNLGGGIVTDTT